MRTIRKGLGLLKKKKVETEPFLTAIYPFLKWETAMRRTRKKDAFKVLLEMGS